MVLLASPASAQFLLYSLHRLKETRLYPLMEAPSLQPLIYNLQGDEAQPSSPVSLVSVGNESAPPL